MTASPLMVDEELQQWILRRLGAPMVKVELTCEHLQDAITNAKRWFAAKKGVRRLKTIYVASGVNEYPLPDDVDVVIDVTFTSQKIDLSLLAAPFILPEQQIPYNVFSTPMSGGLYSNYVQMTQHVEMAKRIMGAEPDWRQEGRILYIFPVPPTSSMIMLDCTSHVFNIDALNERDHDLLKRYALAMAKIDLGRVRSKYGEWPTAQGTTSLDGDKLLEEGRTDIEALNEEIGKSGYPMMPLIG